jgi:predicted ArsR family transcriptional regulator
MWPRSTADTIRGYADWTMALTRESKNMLVKTRDGRREAIVDELQASGPLDAAGLGRRLGLHPNTVRFHLGRLRDAGLVTARPAERGTPGRPRILYALESSVSHDVAQEHRLLATMLAGAIAGLPDGPAQAEAAGRAWGSYLVKRPLPLARTSDEDAQADIVELRAHEGFEPESSPGEIRMRRCPFHELAEMHPQVICAAHRGLIAGGLEELRAGVELERIEVFPEPDLCIAHLGPSSR